MRALTQERYHAEFEAETARLGAVVSGLDPDLPVPTCPEWTVRDLVTHVGTGHRWSAGIIEERRESPPAFERVPAPGQPAEFAEWLAAGARRLSDAVRGCPPSQPVWTWQGRRTADFWLRRMLHDELVHRFDAEFTAGNRTGDVAADLAVDGISDLLTTAATLSAPAVAHGGFGALAGTGQTMSLRATDPAPGTAAEWLVRRTPDGVAWEYCPGPADVTVSGTARDLLLVLNRRLEPGEGVEISGDPDLFAYWLEHSAF